MRILHAAETVKGGVATVVQLLCEGTSSKGSYSVKCIVPRSQAAEMRSLPDESLATFADRGRGLWTCASFLVTFCMEVLSFKPDVVHLHSTFAGALGRVALFFLRPVTRPKIVYCPHAFAFMMSNAGAKARLYVWIERTLSYFTDSIICVSSHERDLAIEHGIHADKLRLVYNGTPPPAPPTPEQRSEVSAPLRLLFVGRFDFAKGFDILLSAMEKVEGLPVHLTSVGVSAAEVSESASVLSNVTYLGWIPRQELSRYFYESDVLIVPSRWEGFAMAPIEAMSHGLAVISSDFPSLKEAVIDGKNGRVFPSLDSEALANIIRSTSREDLSEMGRCGYDFYSRRFTANAMCELTSEIYSDLIGSSS